MAQIYQGKQIIPRQTNIPKLINFTEKLEDGGATMFFVAENYSNLFFRFTKCYRIIQTMKHKKKNLLNEASDSKFVTRNWNIVNDQSNANYSVGKEIIYSTEVLKSDICDYHDVYILVKRDITIIGHNVAQVAFANCTPFIQCITKIDEATIDGAEDLDLVMLMCNLLEYSSNYSDTTGSLSFYSNDKATNFNNDIGNRNNFKSFKYKARLLGSTVAHGVNEVLRNTNCYAIKDLSHFWRSLEVPFIICKVELKLKWTKHCFFL